MKLRVGDTVREGRVLDVRDLGVSGATVAAAIHTDTPAAGSEDGSDSEIRVVCQTPGPAHEHVGFVHPGVQVDRRAALAAAARSRGRTVPKQAAVAATRERLGELSVPSIDLTEARRAVADAGGDEARLRESVAELRGRIQTLRDAGKPTDSAVADLTQTARQLSEAETERIAAEQRLDRAARAAREARDARERRLRLEDRVGNLERRVRAALAASVDEEFEAAIRAVPGEGVPTDRDELDPVTVALAVGRVADLYAPVVLGVDRFASADAAADLLDAPVIRV